MPGGGLSPDRERWVHSRPSFLLSVRVLSLRCPTLFLKALHNLQLRVFSEGLAPLSTLDGHRQFLDRLRRKEWVVCSKPPFGSPSQALENLARHTQRVAISNHRLLAIEGGKARFHRRDYRQGGQNKPMTLDAVEFMRRFLLQVLPDKVRKIRYFGFLCPANRKRLRLCREVLEMPPPPEDQDQGCPSAYMQRYERLTGKSLLTHPACGTGTTVYVCHWLAGDPMPPDAPKPS